MSNFEKKALKVQKQLEETLEAFPSVARKLLLDCWNKEAPHFGGGMPHRYDDGDKVCGYCLRPKNWKPGNYSLYFSDESGSGKQK